MSITRGIVYEDSDATLLDQIKVAGAFANVADISSVQVVSIDLDSGDVVKTTNFTNTEVMVDTLRLDLGWTRDEIGWNSHISLDGSEHWPIGGRTYRIEVTYQLTNGGTVRVYYELQCIERYADGAD